MNQDQNADNKTRLRKRRVRKQKRTEANTGQTAARYAQLLTLVAALIYVGVNYAQLAHLRESYGILALNESANDVRYKLGNPSQLSADHKAWTYHTPDRVMAVSFDDQDKLVTAECSASTAQIDTCPFVGSIGLGASESDLLLALGSPTQLAYQGQGKVASYPGLGYQFTLQQEKIVAIKHERPSNSAAYAFNLLWALLP